MGRGGPKPEKVGFDDGGVFSPPLHGPDGLIRPILQVVRFG